MCGRKRTTRPGIPQEPRIRAELQKEIGSRCPFCTSVEVGHFEIHHINGDCADHSYENLILLCKICHSKFTKKEWLEEKAIEEKKKLLIKIDFRGMESKPKDNFDYLCFAMKKSNGREIEEMPNGSVANIQVIDIFKYKITVKQSDQRIWSGTLELEDQISGKMSFKYNHEFEVGHKMCYIDDPHDPRFQTKAILLHPLTDLSNYEKEILVRKSE